MPRLPESERFRTFMAQGWGEPDRSVPLAAGAREAGAAHRARLSAALPGTTLIVATGRSQVRANDTEYPFRPDTAFTWLSYCAAEAAVLVMTPAGSSHDATLYLTEPAYAGDSSFYEDAMRGELWVGAASGLGEWADALGLEVRSLRELPAALDAVAGDALFAGGSEPALDAVRRPSAELERTLSELRMIKDEWEIGQMRLAVDASVTGFSEVVREIPRAIESGGERWLQATFERHARTNGNGVGYTTITGSGGNAATMHWMRCDGPVLPEHLILLDAGVEVDTLYTADVTRAFPASGRFSAAQRQVYELVEQAHYAALATVRPGALFTDFQEAAHEVLARGLHEWGITPGTLDEALRPEGQLHRRYAASGNGHHLGLDVHDCAKSSEELYLRTPLQENMVFTVEPGLYFHAHDLTLPPELRGIGVRIEDDLLVTTDGYENLSGALPTTVDGLEKWVGSLIA